MSQADFSDTTPSPETERRVPRWPVDDAAGETFIGRLFAEWQDASRESRETADRLEQIEIRLDQEAPTVPKALIVRGSDWTLGFDSVGTSGPAGLHWYDPQAIDKKLRRLAAIRIEGKGNEASIIRAKEIVEAAGAYKDEIAALKASMGYVDAYTANQVAATRERLMRWRIVAQPASTFSDIVAKARIAEDCVGDVDEELASHLEGGHAGDTSFQLSLLQDVLAFART